MGSHKPGREGKEDYLICIYSVLYSVLQYVLLEISEFFIDS